MEHLANDSISAIENKTIFILPQNFPKDSIKKRQHLNFFFSFRLVFKYYFIKQGFRDGKAGFIFCCS